MVENGEKVKNRQQPAEYGQKLAENQQKTPKNNHNSNIALLSHLLILSYRKSTMPIMEHFVPPLQ